MSLMLNKLDQTLHDEIHESMLKKNPKTLLSNPRLKVLDKLKDDFNMKLEIHFKIQKLPRNSAKIRIRNRCWKTGRPRGFYRDFGVSRHVLREMAHQCLLPGVTKSSW